MRRQRGPRGARKSRIKGPTEGGTGGRRGHSNMEHSAYSDEIKVAARRQRRAVDRRITREAGSEPGGES
jgi:hypothetical protein